MSAKSSRQKSAPSSRGARAKAPVESAWASRWPVIAVWLAVLAAIAFLPGGFNRWVLPKDAVLALAAVAGSLAVARGRLPRWFWIVVGIGALLLVVAGSASASPLGALFGRFPRFEGLVTLPVYLAAVWLGARVVGPRLRERTLKAVHAASSTAAILLGIVSVIEAFGGRPISSDLSRPGALLGNATDQGILGAMLLVFLLPVLTDGSEGGGTVPWMLRNRWVPLVGAIFAAVTIVISGSRAALLAAFIGLGVLIVLAVLRSRRRSREDVPTASKRGRLRLPLIAIGVAALGLLALTALTTTTRERVLGQSALSGQTIDDRLLIWRSAGELLAQRPLLGVGPSGFLDAVTKTYPNGSLGEQTVLDAPHSWPLQFALAGGLPLFVLALGAAVAVLVFGVRAIAGSASRAPAASAPTPTPTPTSAATGIGAGAAEARSTVLVGALAAVVACGVGLATHLTSPGTAIFACLLIGSLIARPEASISVSGASVRARSVRRRLARTVGLSAWAFVLVIGAVGELTLQAALDVSHRNAAQASGFYSAAQAMRPWDVDLPSIAAESFAAASDNDIPGSGPLAVSWARRSLALTPNTQASLVALGVGLQAEKKLNEAEAVLQKAVDRNAANEQAAYRLGFVQAAAGDYSTARGHLLAAAKLDPTDAAPWNVLAFVYQQLGDATKADAAHAKAVKLGG